MSEWKETNLADCIDKMNQGVNTTTEKVFYTNSGIKVIRAKNIFDYKIDFDDVVFIDNKTYDRLSTNVKPKRGNVLYTNIGSQLGSAALVKSDEHFITAWNVLRIQTNSNKLNPIYLVYFLNNPSTKEDIRGYDSSSTMPFVSGKVLGAMKILIPPLPEQERIAEVLSSLDDKIDLLKKQNKTLEKMAETLFRQWLSKLNDRETTTLGEYIRIQNGYAFKSNDFKDSGNNGILKITNISNEQVDIHNTQFVDDNVVSELSEKFLATPKSFLIAMTGAEIGKIGIIERTNKRLYINQRVGMLVDILENSSLLGYLFLKSAEGQDHIVNTCTGSAQENISSFGIESMLVPKSSPEEVSSFCNSANPLFEKIIYNLEHIQKLSTLRDTLLPKLMSGEVRVQNLNDQNH
jgi:type I restriction enzyme S subunit